MKFFLVSLLFVVVAFARSTVQHQEIHGEGPVCPIDDPLERDGPVPLNLTLHDILNIELGSQLTNLKIDGLSTFHYNVYIIELVTAFYFDVSIGNVIGTAGDYLSSGYMDARPFSQETIPSGNFTGSGAGSFSANNVKLNGHVGYFISLDNKVAIHSLRLDVVSFDSLTVDLGPDFIVAGRSVDWDALSAGIKENFDNEFAANKGEIIERFRKAANAILKNYTFKELIDLLPGFGDGGEPEC